MSWTSGSGGDGWGNRLEAGRPVDKAALPGCEGRDAPDSPDGGAAHDTLDLGALFGSAWSPVTDGSGALAFSYSPDGAAVEATLHPRTSDTVLCYAAGTRIATPAGEVPIEALRVGDLVTCAAPQAGARPILWVGRIEVHLAGHPQPESAWPIRIRAGALGEGRPRRDLRVSPDHGIYLGGVLVPARLLVDGITIVQERWWASITYLHLELPEHAILLAEGLPAESWLDDGRRGAFDNAGLSAQFVDFGLELAAERPAGNFPLILDPAAAACLRDSAAPRPRAPMLLSPALTWAARGATKLAEDSKDTRHAPPPVRWRQRRHPDRAEA